MLDRAKFLVISEVSEVTRQNAIEVEARVDRALDKCFMSKARATARAKAAKATTTRVPPRRAARAS
jgi:hypothetical protein